MVLNVSKFNFYFPDHSFNFENARTAFEQSLQILDRSDLADMEAGVSTDGMRVAGVPVRIDDWVQAFILKAARAAMTDVAKFDVVMDGHLHIQLLNFCHNTRMAFFGRNTPTPLLSAIIPGG